MIDREASSSLQKCLCRGLVTSGFSTKGNLVYKPVGGRMIVVEAHRTQVSSIILGFYWVAIENSLSGGMQKKWETSILAEAIPYWILGVDKSNVLMTTLGAFYRRQDISPEEVKVKCDVALSLSLEVIEYMEQVNLEQDLSEQVAYGRIKVWNEEIPSARS